MRIDLWVSRVVSKPEYYCATGMLRYYDEGLRGSWA